MEPGACLLKLVEVEHCPDPRVGPGNQPEAIRVLQGFGKGFFAESPTLSSGLTLALKSTMGLRASLRPLVSAGSKDPQIFLASPPDPVKEAK